MEYSPIITRNSLQLACYNPVLDGLGKAKRKNDIARDCHSVTALVDVTSILATVSREGDPGGIWEVLVLYETVRPEVDIALVRGI